MTYMTGNQSKAAGIHQRVESWDWPFKNLSGEVIPAFGLIGIGQEDAEFVRTERVQPATTYDEDARDLLLKAYQPSVYHAEMQTISTLAVNGPVAVQPDRIGMCTMRYPARVLHTYDSREISDLAVVGEHVGAKRNSWSVSDTGDAFEVIDIDRAGGINYKQGTKRTRTVWVVPSRRRRLDSALISSNEASLLYSDEVQDLSLFEDQDSVTHHDVATFEWVGDAGALGNHQRSFEWITDHPSDDERKGLYIHRSGVYEIHWQGHVRPYVDDPLADWGAASMYFAPTVIAGEFPDRSLKGSVTYYQRPYWGRTLYRRDDEYGNEDDTPYNWECVTGTARLAIMESSILYVRTMVASEGNVVQLHLSGMSCYITYLGPRSHLGNTISQYVQNFDR